MAIKLLRFVGTNDHREPAKRRDVKAAKAIEAHEQEGWTLVSISEMWPNDEHRLLVTLRRDGPQELYPFSIE